MASGDNFIKSSTFSPPSNKTAKPGHWSRVIWLKRPNWKKRESINPHRKRQLGFDNIDLQYKKGERAVWRIFSIFQQFSMSITEMAGNHRHSTLALKMWTESLQEDNKWPKKKILPKWVWINPEGAFLLIFDTQYLS